MDELWKTGYDAGSFYAKSEKLQAVMDTLRRGFAGNSFSNLVNYFLFGHGVSDPYMCMADFESYMNASARIREDYKDRTLWNRRSLANIAGAGFFASDRSIKEYAEKIWHTKPVKE